MTSVEDRYYNREWSLSLLMAATTAVLLFTLLFSLFFELSRASSALNELDTRLSLIITTGFAVLCIVFKILRRRTGYEYSTVMLMTSLCFIFTEASLIILVRQMMTWDLTGIVNADFTHSVYHIAGTSLKVGAVFFVAMLVEMCIPARHGNPVMGRLWFFNCIAPAYIFPIIILLTTLVGKKDRYGISVIILSVYFSYIACLAVRYLFKTVMFHLVSGKHSMKIESIDIGPDAKLHRMLENNEGRKHLAGVLSFTKAQRKQFDDVIIEAALSGMNSDSDRDNVFVYEIAESEEEGNKPEETAVDVEAEIVAEDTETEKTAEQEVCEDAEIESESAEEDEEQIAEQADEKMTEDAEGSDIAVAAMSMPKSVLEVASFTLEEVAEDIEPTEQTAEQAEDDSYNTDDESAEFIEVADTAEETEDAVESEESADAENDTEIDTDGDIISEAERIEETAEYVAEQAAEPETSEEKETTKSETEEQVAEFAEETETDIPDVGGDSEQSDELEHKAEDETAEQYDESAENSGACENRPEDGKTDEPQIEADEVFEQNELSDETGAVMSENSSAESDEKSESVEKSEPVEAFSTGVEDAVEIYDGKKPIESITPFRVKTAKPARKSAKESFSGILLFFKRVKNGIVKAIAVVGAAFTAMFAALAVAGRFTANVFSAITGFVVKIFKGIAAAVSVAGKALTSAIVAAAKGVALVFTSIAKGTASVFTSIAKGIAFVARKLAGLVSRFAKAIVGAVGRVAPIIKNSACKAFTKTADAVKIVLNKTGRALTAVFRCITGFCGNMWNKLSDRTKSGLKKFGGFTARIFTGAVDAVKRFAVFVAGKTVSASRTIAVAFAAFIRRVAGFAARVFRVGISAVGRVAVTAADLIGRAAKFVWGKLKELISKLGELIKREFEKLAAAIKAFAVKMTDNIKRIAKEFVAKAVSKSKEFAGKTASALKTIAGRTRIKAVELTAEAWNRIKEKSVSAAKLLKAFSIKTADWIKTEYKRFIEWSKQTYIKLKPVVKEYLIKTKKYLKDFFFGKQD